MMAEYINREALSEYFREKFEYYKAESEIKVCGGYMYDEKMQYAAIVAKHFLDELKRTPTADVVEVVHGEWIIKDDDYDCELMCCSVCKSEFYDGDNDTVDCRHNYCPNCGAKMDGDKK
jgi:hypothetical protein